MKRMYSTILVFLLGVPLLLLPAALMAGEQAGQELDDRSCTSAFMNVLKEIERTDMFALLDTTLVQVRALPGRSQPYSMIRPPEDPRLRRLSGHAAHAQKSESLLTAQIENLETVQSQMLQCAVHCDRAEAPAGITVIVFNPDTGMSAYRRNIAAALAAFNEARLALIKEARHLPSVHLEQLTEIQAPLIAVIEASLKVCEE